MEKGDNIVPENYHRLKGEARAGGFPYKRSDNVIWEKVKTDAQLATTR